MTIAFNTANSEVENVKAALLEKSSNSNT